MIRASAHLVMALRLAVTVGLGVGLVLASGCGQSVGERCQQDSDCQSDLRCAIPPESGARIGGVCVGVNAVDLAVSFDFAAAADLSSHD